MYSGSNLAPGGITQSGSNTIAGVIDNIAISAKIDPHTCEAVVGTVLSVIQHEDQVHATAIFAAMPGAAELARAYDVMDQETHYSGVIDTLINNIDSHFSEPVRAGMNGLSRIAQSGLSAAQLQEAATTLLERIKQAAGPAVAASALSSTPLLKARLGV